MKVTVVYGPPCSGKSTWARERAGESDAIYDYDRILRAITTKDNRSTDKHAAHKFVTAFRGTFLNRLKYDKEVEKAYFITRYPDKALKDTLAELDPEYHMMDTELEACLERLENDGQRPDKDAWEEIIRRWFKDHANESEKRYAILAENRKYLGGIK